MKSRLKVYRLLLLVIIGGLLNLSMQVSAHGFLKNETADTAYSLTDADVVVTNGVIESCSYDFTITDIIIPDMLDGQIITGIADHVGFSPGVFEEKGITSVQLPSTLKIIGAAAFAYNRNLTGVIIPNSVEQIKDSAFIINDLTSIFIPKSVKYIGYVAFYGNNLIEAIFESGSNIELIQFLAFDDNPGLTSITLPTNANHGFVAYKDMNEITYNPGDVVSDFYTFYESVIEEFPVDSSMTYVPDDNFEQALIDLGYDSGPLNDSVPTANIKEVTFLRLLT